MTARLRRLLHRHLVCKYTCHDIDWVHDGMYGLRRCIRCWTRLPEPTSRVSALHPDQGE